LQRIADTDLAGTYVLRLSAPEVHCSGRVVFSDCTYVVAAQTRDGVSEGYEALKVMLKVSLGSYAYLKVGEKDHLDLIANLHVPLAKIIETTPDLPDDPRQLFDEKTLLDRIFTSGVRESLPKSNQPLPAMDSSKHQPRPSEPRQMPEPVNPDQQQLFSDHNNSNRKWNVSDSVIYQDDPGEDGAPPSEPASSPEFGGLDAESIRTKAAQERQYRYVRRSQRPAMRASPLIVVGLLLLLFSGEVASILFWPRVAAYLKEAVNHSPSLGVDSKAHERRR